MNITNISENQLENAVLNKGFSKEFSKTSSVGLSRNHGKIGPSKISLLTNLKSKKWGYLPLIGAISGIALSCVGVYKLFQSRNVPPPHPIDTPSPPPIKKDFSPYMKFQLTDDLLDHNSWYIENDYRNIQSPFNENKVDLLNKPNPPSKPEKILYINNQDDKLLKTSQNGDRYNLKTASFFSTVVKVGTFLIGGGACLFIGKILISSYNQRKETEDTELSQQKKNLNEIFIVETNDEENINNSKLLNNLSLLITLPSLNENDINTLYQLLIKAYRKKILSVKGLYDYIQKLDEIKESLAKNFLKNLIENKKVNREKLISFNSILISQKFFKIIFTLEKEQFLKGNSENFLNSAIQFLMKCKDDRNTFVLNELKELIGDKKPEGKKLIKPEGEKLIKPEGKKLIKSVFKNYNTENKDNYYYNYLINYALKKNWGRYFLKKIDSSLDNKKLNNYENNKLLYEPFFSLILEKINIPKDDDRDNFIDRCKTLTTNIFSNLKTFSSFTKIFEFYLKNASQSITDQYITELTLDSLDSLNNLKDNEYKTDREKIVKYKTDREKIVEYTLKYFKENNKISMALEFYDSISNDLMFDDPFLQSIKEKVENLQKVQSNQNDQIEDNKLTPLYLRENKDN